MSTTEMSQTLRAEPRTRPLWSLWGAAAGVLGIVGTIITDAHPRTFSVEDTYTSGVISDVPYGLLRPGMIAGYLAVAALLVFAAAWQTRIARPNGNSIASAVAPLGLIATAGGLALAYGWKGALGLYGEGGPEAGAFDETGLYVYYVLNDFGAYIPWLGAIVAAGAIAWASLRDGVIPKWLGVVSAVPPVLVLFAVSVTGVPGLPALLAPLWLIVLSAGLFFSKSR